MARQKALDKTKLIINVDASTNNKNGSRGLGVMVRDSIGEVVFFMTILWHLPISIEAAEVLAIK